MRSGPKVLSWRGLDHQRHRSLLPFLSIRVDGEDEENNTHSYVYSAGFGPYHRSKEEQHSPLTEGLRETGRSGTLKQYSWTSSLDRATLRVTPGEVGTEPLLVLLRRNKGSADHLVLPNRAPQREAANLAQPEAVSSNIRVAS
jgi:hypothetical protein